MRYYTVVLLLLLTISMTVPVMAANADRYSYITVRISRSSSTMEVQSIHVNYKVDEVHVSSFFCWGNRTLKTN